MSDPYSASYAAAVEIREAVSDGLLAVERELAALRETIRAAAIFGSLTHPQTPLALRVHAIVFRDIERACAEIDLESVPEKVPGEAS